MADKKALLATALVIFAGGQAMAEQASSQTALDGISLSGDVGLMNIDAHEFVWEGDYKLSQLDWESRGVVLYTLGAEAELQGDFLLKANFAAAMTGDSYLTDYDWLQGGPNGMDDWTDRSRHPDTRLDYYFQGTLELQRRMWADDDTEIQLGGGVEVTDVKWSAYGGSYIYSDAGFRDDTGTFPAGDRGISYRMQIPVGFASVAMTQRFGDLTLGGGLKAGLSFGIDDTDDHWKTATRFYDRMNAAPMIGVDLQASYAMAENFSIYMGGSYEKIFEAGGSMEIHDTKTGDVGGPYDGSAGASYQSMNLTFGFKRQF